MKNKKAIKILMYAVICIVGFCIGFSGCKKEEKKTEIHTMIAEEKQEGTLKETPIIESKETEKEANEVAPEGKELGNSEVTEVPEQNLPGDSLEEVNKDIRKSETSVENEDSGKGAKQESPPVSKEETKQNPDPIPESAPVPTPESNPEPPSVTTPEESKVQTGFDAEKENILFFRINASRGGDLVEGTWAKNKAREKAKAADGSGSGVLYGFDTTGDVNAIADTLIASYASTIGMDWKSFGCGVYQNGGTYYYCVVFDTMVD